AELDTLSEERRTHSIQIDDDLYMVGPATQEDADYFNHSCAPNTGIVGNILLVAMRDIAAGEEICFDYATCDAADYDEFDCACGEPACRKVVTGADWKLAELRDRYDGWRSTYLQRRLDDGRL
ncbi:MAG TPA: SET domain-containing protein-lysine N-methyltransferase, partial [Acidimicrobiia bacterium]